MQPRCHTQQTSTCYCSTPQCTARSRAILSEIGLLRPEPADFCRGTITVYLSCQPIFSALISRNRILNMTDQLTPSCETDRETERAGESWRGSSDLPLAVSRASERASILPAVIRPPLPCELRRKHCSPCSSPRDRDYALSPPRLPQRRSSSSALRR